MYQHLMNYWSEVMQDDCYIISADGWKAGTYRIIVENKAKKKVDKGWTCDLVTKELVINRYFKAEKEAIEDLYTEKETIANALTELEEEHNTEDGFFDELEKINKGTVLKELKKLKSIDMGCAVEYASFYVDYEGEEKNEEQNAHIGDVFSINSQNNLVHSPKKMVATIGIDNLVIVDTDDALLVAHKDQIQDVKKIVEQLKSDNRTEHNQHRQVHRPWGSYDSIDNGTRYQVKRITVKPSARLSLQMHHHRAEHWVVVSGTAIVEVEGSEQMLTENQSVYIPIGATHRLTNPGKLPLELIEVQSGSYLGEDDIVRFEDNFGRCN